MVVDIILNICWPIMMLGPAFSLTRFRRWSELMYGVPAIIVGMTVTFKAEVTFWDRLFQIYLYGSGVYAIYTWWKDDDDFRNKRKKWASKAKVKFRTFVVFKPPAVANR
jgi:hypothetical protein